jgi:DNA-binding NarL/FixJ family response regulator
VWFEGDDRKIFWHAGFGGVQVDVGSFSALKGFFVNDLLFCDLTTYAAGSPGAAPARILIADDHDVVCAGLQRMIAGEAGMEILGTASNGAQAVELAMALNPDVAILDVEMDGVDGVEATREIRKACPKCEVLLFTGMETDELMRQAFLSGAKSFILKSDARVHLLGAIRALAQHKPYFTSKVSAVIFSRLLEKRPVEEAGTAGPGRLNEREMELLRRIALGDGNRDVALKLGVNLRTVEGHRSALMRKMGFESLADLVKYAVRNGIVEL